MWVFVVSSAYLCLSIYEFSIDEETCSIPQRPLVTLFFGVELLNALIKIPHHQCRRLHPDFVFLMESLRDIILVVMLIIFPVNLLNSPYCMSDTYRTAMAFFFLPILFIVIIGTLLILMFTIYYASKQLWKNYNQVKFRKKILVMLKRSLLNPEELATFYEANKKALKSVELLDEELVYFKDNFETKFGQLPKNDYQADQCLICLEDFETDTPVICFPKCRHVYHMDCLNQWLHKKKVCALCKTEFRINFGEALKEKTKNQFSILSPQLEQMLEKSESNSQTFEATKPKKELLPNEC